MTPQAALLLYLGTALATIITLWILADRRAAKRRYIPPEKKLFQCEFCTHTYTSEANKRVTRCPQCDQFN